MSRNIAIGLAIFWMLQNYITFFHMNITYIFNFNLIIIKIIITAKILFSFSYNIYKVYRINILFALQMKNMDSKYDLQEIVWYIS